MVSQWMKRDAIPAINGDTSSEEPADKVPDFRVISGTLQDKAIKLWPLAS